MKHEFYAYPWNLHDIDADAVRLRGLGMTGVTVAASYHAGKFIQPTDPRGRVYFPQDGSIYFRPQRRYGQLKPLVSTLTQGRDVLAELTAREDLQVSAWVVLNHNSRLGFAHPYTVVRNCFGDSYPYSLCPAHPAVREYAVTLCVDLAEGYPLNRLLLESPGYLTYAHGYHHEFAQVVPNVWLDALLGLCFCDACRRRASEDGIDMEGLAQRVCASIDSYLCGSSDLDEAQASERLEQLNAADLDLMQLHALRAEIVTSLVRDIRSAVRKSVRVEVISTTQRPHAGTYLEGGDLTALAQACDGLELPLYQPSVDDLQRDAAYVWERVEPARTSAILRPGPPDMRDETQLRQSVDFLRQAGVSGISFYNLGLLRPHHLTWVQRALA